MERDITNTDFFCNYLDLISEFKNAKIPKEFRVEYNAHFDIPSLIQLYIKLSDDAKIYLHMLLALQQLRGYIDFYKRVNKLYIIEIQRINSYLNETLEEVSKLKPNKEIKPIKNLEKIIESDDDMNE